MFPTRVPDTAGEGAVVPSAVAATVEDRVRADACGWWKYGSQAALDHRVVSGPGSEQVPSEQKSECEAKRKPSG